VGPGLRAAARPPGPPTRWAATGGASGDRVVFDELVQVLAFGCGYRRIADATCPATTLRRRRGEWIRAGVAEQLRLAVLGADDRVFGLELEHLAVDGCTTKAPCGGRVAARSPVDRRKHGLERSVATDAGGIPLAMVGQIATHGLPAPIQVGRRWPVERTHAWANQYGKLRWCTGRRRIVVEFWLALAGAAIVCGRLVRHSWACYRWDARPRRPP
jgi:transposase